MFNIEINDSEVHSYSMGHMIFFDGKVTSQNKQPSQKMMIFLSLVQLLDGISSLLSKKVRAVEFGAVDSSFSLTFSLVKNTNMIKAIHKTKEIGTYPVQDFCEEIHNAVKPLLDKLDTGEVIYADLLDSLTEFNRLR